MAASFHSSPATRILPWLALLLPPLLWAGNFIAGRAVHNEMAPLTLSMGRWLIALACLLPFAIGAMRRDAARYWQHRWLIVGTAATGMAAFNSLVYLGLQTTSASSALLMNSLIPLLIPILAAVLYRQRLSKGQVVGSVLALIGVWTLLRHGQWFPLDGTTFVRGDALVLTAMLCFALYTLWLRRLPADLDRLGLTATQIAVALLLIFPMWLCESSGSGHRTWTWTAGVSMLYVGIFPSILAYLLYMRAVQHFGAASAGLSIHLIPLFGLALSALVLHERLYAWHALGLAAIAAGVVCSQLGKGQATAMRAQAS